MFDEECTICAFEGDNTNILVEPTLTLTVVSPLYEVITASQLMADDEVRAYVKCSCGCDWYTTDDDYYSIKNLFFYRDGEENNENPNLVAFDVNGAEVEAPLDLPLYRIKRNEN